MKISTPLVAADYNRLECSMGLTPRPVKCTGYGVDLSKIPCRSTWRASAVSAILASK